MDLSTRTTRPEDLSADERRAFTDALYQAHCEVFAGVERQAFAAYVVDSKAERTEIRTFHAPDGELAGYIAMHYFDRVLDGRDSIIVRAEAGMRRAWRGANKVGPFMVRQILQQVLGDDRPALYMGSLVHPSSFCGLTRHAPAFWPNPAEPTPPEVLDFMVGLAEDFHLDPVDPERPLVRQVGWITRDTPAERAFWARSDNPLARFFIEQNPRYDLGHGLVTLIPIGRAELFEGVRGWGSRTLGRKLSRMGASWRRLTGQARLTVDEAAAGLAASEALSGVGQAELRELLQAGTQVEHPAGTVLFRQGQDSDAMYVILEGACFVLVDSGIGEDVVVDQLDRGQGFGELGVVSGAPRTATIRTAIDSVLLKVGRAELRRLVQAHPELDAVLWGNVGRFRFDDLVRGRAPFTALDRVQRQAWWTRGEQQHLGEGERWTAPADGWLVVFEGQVELSGQPWASLGAPSMVQVPAGQALCAPEETRLALLPPSPEIGESSAGL